MKKTGLFLNSFGLTEMGRDLLGRRLHAQTDNSSLIYPEDEIGKKFWKRIYEEAAKKIWHNQYSCKYV